MNTLLKVVVGSKAYGLDNDQSDTDTATIFALPTEAILSISQPKGTEQVSEDEGDTTSWEVQRFIKLAISGNPTVLETLWTPPLEMNEFGIRLRDIRQSFLSRRVIGSYAGYAKQQASKLERKYVDAGEMNYQMQKHLSHMLRLVIAGTHVVIYNEVLVEVPKEYKEFLLGVKRGTVSRQSAMELFNSLSRIFERAIEGCSLPQKPDLETINTLLLEIRRYYWR